MALEMLKLTLTDSLSKISELENVIEVRNCLHEASKRGMKSKGFTAHVVIRVGKLAATYPLEIDRLDVVKALIGRTDDLLKELKPMVCGFNASIDEESSKH